MDGAVGAPPQQTVSADNVSSDTQSSRLTTLADTLRSKRHSYANWADRGDLPARVDRLTAIRFTFWGVFQVELPANPDKDELEGRPYDFSTDLSKTSTPFHVIWTPMHSRTNAITRRMPWAVCGGTRAVMAGARP